MRTSDDATTKQKKPWPMTWVAAAIIVYIVAYTFINLEYRKQEAPHEPWAEAEARRNSYIQSARADWTRFRTTLESAEAPEPAADSKAVAPVETRPTPAKLEDVVPLELAMIVPARPILYASPDRIVAPATLTSPAPLKLTMHFDNGQARRELGEFMAFAKDHHLYLFLQDGERLPEGFEPTPATQHLAAVLPEDALPPGEWKATLYSAENIFDWQFEVR